MTKWQQMMMMEQRRLDQQRESELRREQQARDQQFSMQQMSFMREMMRTKDNDGFFDSDMKGIFKQKMVENLLDGGSSSESALERVAGRLLQPEILGAVATGASAALAKNQPNRPAGYDSPNYDPYAGSPVAAPPVATNTGLAPVDGLPLCTQVLLTAIQYSPVSASYATPITSPLERLVAEL